MTDHRELLEKLPVGVTLHDADGTILETNARFCEMLGYSREELLALEFEDLHVDEPPFTSERAAELVQRAAEEGPLTFEWLDRTKGGDSLPVEVTLDRTTLEEEERILAVVRDISGRKRRESELERQNERLENFASIVSHDIRNPLNVVHGRLALAKEDCDSEHLDAIEEAADRMAELIQDLLRLARDSQGSTPRRAVDLEAATEASWRHVETGQASLEIVSDETVEVVPSQLQQLLENLFRNAVEHGGEDVTVTVGTLESQPGFYVEDDGQGFETDDAKVPFEAGYSTTDTGAGLGLSIVRQIADEHGWNLRATEGSTGGARIEVATDEGATSTT